jgi:type IV secretion system protein VirB6
MMASCPALASGETFVSSLFLHIDCQAEAIGTYGYQALASPGSPISLALTGLLTIFIALFGLRIALGQPPALPDVVIGVVRIGVVLLIATSWPAFRTVVYAVIVESPAQLSAVIGRSAGLPGGQTELVTHLQASDAAMARLITVGSGRNDLSSRPPQSAAGSSEAPRGPISDDVAFGSARVLFLSSAIAAHAVVRITAGLLLALAPLFAGLLLFDMARGLFAGWLRALIFTLLASVLTTVVIGVELALLDPWLAGVLRLREARIITASAPLELLVLCLAFAIALAAAFGVLLRLAFTMNLSLSLPSLARRIDEATASMAPVASGTGPVLNPITAGSGGGTPSRALVLASALQAAQRREAVAYGHAGGEGGGRSVAHGFASPSAPEAFAIPAYGSAGRRTRSRKSIGGARRDRRI